MTTQEADAKSDDSNATGIGSTPDSILAQKVIDALVADGLVSEDDGLSIRANLAAGKVDAGSWRLVLENQLEREVCTDEPK